MKFNINLYQHQWNQKVIKSFFENKIFKIH